MSKKKDDEKKGVSFKDTPAHIVLSIPTAEQLRENMQNSSDPLGIFNNMHLPGLGKLGDLDINLTDEQKVQALDVMLKSDHRLIIQSCTTCGADLLTPWDLMGENRKAVMSEIGLGGTVNEPTILSVKSVEEMTAELQTALKEFHTRPLKFWDWQDIYNPRPELSNAHELPMEEVLEQRRLSSIHQISTIKLSEIGNQVDEYCSTHEDDSRYPLAAEGEYYTIKQDEPSIFSDKWYVIPADWIRWRFFDKFGYTTSGSTELVTVAAMLEIVKEAEVIRRKLRTLRAGMSNVFIKKPEFYVPGTRLISLQWVAWIAVERGMTFEEAYRNSIKD